MTVNFDKMHGLGNDFVMIEVSQLAGVDDIPDFCRTISHRKFGVGCDLVTIYKYDARSATVKASFFNADGSESEICGNAARCLGLLIKMHYQRNASVTLDSIALVKIATGGATSKCDASEMWDPFSVPSETYASANFNAKAASEMWDPFSVPSETYASANFNAKAASAKVGIDVGFTNNKTYQISIDAQNNVSVNFGKPTATVLSRRVFDQMNLSLIDDFRMGDALWSSLEELGVYHVSCLSVGNPHLVFFLKQMPSLALAQYLGARFESDALFPNKTNVSFAKITSDQRDVGSNNVCIDLIVFERADGLTLACGSGALATAFVAHQREFLKTNAITVKQRGGTLLITIDDDGNCTQTGAATHVFSGSMTNVTNVTNVTVLAAPAPTLDSASTLKTVLAHHDAGSDSISACAARVDVGIKLDEVRPPGELKGNKISVYTDGACCGNPGPGGWGAVILFGKEQKELCGSDADTTNNRMEMMAAICALEYLKSPYSVDLYTDSTYVKEGITKWVSGWQKRNWTNSEGNPVKNKDLWLRLLEATKRHKISWHWVRGHAGNKYNEIVDKLARSQCRVKR